MKLGKQLDFPLHLIKYEHIYAAKDSKISHTRVMTLTSFNLFYCEIHTNLSAFL